MSDWLIATWFVASVGSDSEPRYVGSGTAPWCNDIAEARRFDHAQAAVMAARDEGHIGAVTTVRLCLRGSTHSVSYTGNRELAAMIADERRMLTGERTSRLHAVILAGLHAEACDRERAYYLACCLEAKSRPGAHGEIHEPAERGCRLAYEHGYTPRLGG